MPLTDLLTKFRRPAANEYVAARPATGTAATGSLALNDDEGLKDKILSAPTGTPEQPVTDAPEDQPDPQPEPEDQQDSQDREKPLTVADRLMQEIGGHPDSHTDPPEGVSAEDLAWARRVVVAGDRAMDTPLSGRGVKRDARTNTGTPFTPAQPEPTEGQKAAINYLRETGEIGTVAVPDKGLSELLEAATSQNDEVVDMVLDAIETGGATGTFFDQ